MSQKTWAIVPAAGYGARLPGAVPKQYRQLAGRTLLDHCLARLVAHPGIRSVMVALAADDPHWAASAFADHPKVRCCTGGGERADSVCAALRALQDAPDGPGDHDPVLVHDAARALLSVEALNRLLAEPPGPEGALLAVPAQDTVKLSGDGVGVDSTLERSKIWLAQTPQYFEYRALREALTHALHQGLRITDEASCMELHGCNPRLVLGDALNFKITTAADLKLAAAILEGS